MRSEWQKPWQQGRAKEARLWLECHRFPPLYRIGGVLNASLARSVRNANLQLLSIQKTSLRVSESIRNMGRGILTGLGAGLAIEGMSGFFAESIKLGKQEQLVMVALGDQIAHTNALRGIGLGVSRQQTKAIEEQAKALQEQTATYQVYF